MTCEIQVNKHIIKNELKLKNGPLSELMPQLWINLFNFHLSDLLIKVTFKFAAL